MLFKEMGWQNRAPCSNRGSSFHFLILDSRFVKNMQNSLKFLPQTGSVKSVLQSPLSFSSLLETSDLIKLNLQGPTQPLEKGMRNLSASTTGI